MQLFIIIKFITIKYGIVSGLMQFYKLSEHQFLFILCGVRTKKYDAFYMKYNA